MTDKMNDTEDDVTLTLQEALEEQEYRENQSVAVLGASDPENCSYSKGYMKRQALYACLTCNPKTAPFYQPAGVCLACSYNCHEGHELVELFTKRNFRCDCGNKKFPDNPCRLQSEKDDLNAENVYNQNFSGVYCSCHRPYPETDPDTDTADDPMIQCIICEDWYHFQHSLAYLNTGVDAMEDDFELICGPCVGRLDFLGHYSHLSLKPKLVPVAAAESTCTLNDSSSEKNIQQTNCDEGDKVEVVKTEDTSSQDSGVDFSGSENSSDTSICQLQKRAKEVLPNTELQAVAWKGTLRTALCRCTNCLDMYKKLKIQFLLDDEDTIEHYEALGKKKTEDAQLSAEANLENQVSKLGHVGQLEFVYGYNFLKDQLANFLKRHAEDGRTVRREDVVDFFAKINGEVEANKRRRLE